MGHRPHVYVAPPWDGPVLALPDGTRHHLQRVLRKNPGDRITYTDGRGVGGLGTLSGSGLQRAAEEHHPPPLSNVVIGAAPPGTPSRARTLVEKLAELGCDELVWLTTRHGEGRPPHLDKANSWAVAALEQSRGQHLLRIDGPVSMDHVWPEGYVVFVADKDGDDPTYEAIGAPGAVVLIGPEAGFATDEVPARAHRVRLGPNVLRIETAAILAAFWQVTIRTYG
jgi:16S rRNA (uracil1498-N3)-methyltransferase